MPPLAAAQLPLDLVPAGLTVRLDVPEARRQLERVIEEFRFHLVRPITQEGERLIALLHWPRLAGRRAVYLCRGVAIWLAVVDATGAEVTERREPA